MEEGVSISVFYKEDSLICCLYETKTRNGLRLFFIVSGLFLVRETLKEVVIHMIASSFW